MIDYFLQLENRLSNENNNIRIISNSVLKHKTENTFDLFKFDISDETKYIYNNYKKFMLNWEETILKLHGYVNFVPYDELSKEHEKMCEIAKSIEDDLIENQNVVINDLVNWYPIFEFPNGDAFCYDKRNGKIVFFEHDVFDSGINLHGLVIAETIDFLFEEWSKVLFVDIYDWYEGVGEHGIDVNKPIYENVLHINVR